MSEFYKRAICNFSDSLNTKEIVTYYRAELLMSHLSPSVFLTVFFLFFFFTLAITCRFSYILHRLYIINHLE